MSQSARVLIYPVLDLDRNSIFRKRDQCHVVDGYQTTCTLVALTFLFVFLPPFRVAGPLCSFLIFLLESLNDNFWTPVAAFFSFA